MAHETVIEGIIALLFGHKYYAVIIYTKGTDKIEIASQIHHTLQQAESHRKRIEETLSFGYVETVSFRSRKEY